jgi:hypothetical protein
MDHLRRRLIKAIGVLPMALYAVGSAKAAKSSVKPRHVLCFLGGEHGLARWRELALTASRALTAGDDFTVSRACRLAFAKRPLESEKYVESVGYHLVGLPEVYVAKTLGTDLEKAAIMDAVADELTRGKLEDVLRTRQASLTFASTYREDDFKFNPYGIVHIDRP